MNKKVDIYTDGACSGNPGPGGWGVLIEIDNKNIELSGGDKDTTNNRMELLAVIVALESIKKTSSSVQIYSDSKYVVDSIEKKWVFNWEKKQFKTKKNSDLWIRLLKVYRKHTVSFFWIKGHSENKENERCDLLAVCAAEGDILHIDKHYEENKKSN